MATPEDYRAIFSSEEGKRVLADLKQRSAHGRPTFLPGLEPWQPAFRDGAQSIVQLILDQLETNPTPTSTPTKVKT